MVLGVFSWEILESNGRGWNPEFPESRVGCSPSQAQTQPSQMAQPSPARRFTPATFQSREAGLTDLSELLQPLSSPGERLTD